MRRVCLAAAAALIVAGAGCGSSTPVATAPTITENFSGTVQPQGHDSHNFTVAKYGEVDITLTAAGPPPTITVGLGVGTVSNGSCTVGSIQTTTVAAAATPQLSGNLDAGAYCVTVFDSGNLASPITYTMTVFHP